ncbi:MAG: hypothetical protein PHP62_05340, partial [Candidatus Moranbacteria bacterium]|nr:hypothetical protein [Candidatus Moranbacteria bacterium]
KSVFYIGIMFSNKLILGYRNFSIFGLLGYEIENPRRPELHSLEFRYLEKLNPEPSKNKKNKPAYTKWRIFIPFFAYSNREVVLEQVSGELKNGLGNADNQREHNRQCTGEPLRARQALTDARKGWKIAISEAKNNSALQKKTDKERNEAKSK